MLTISSSSSPSEAPTLMKSGSSSYSSSRSESVIIDCGVSWRCCWFWLCFVEVWNDSAVIFVNYARVVLLCTGFDPMAERTEKDKILNAKQFLWAAICCDEPRKILWLKFAFISYWIRKKLLWKRLKNFWEQKRSSLKLLFCHWPSQTRITVHALHGFPVKRNLKKTLAATFMHIINLFPWCTGCGTGSGTFMPVIVGLQWKYISRHAKSPDIEKELLMMA